MADPEYGEPVWTGRMPLLPERPERWDSRYSAMPSFDIDEEGEIVRSTPKRKYTRTGKHKGEFSRTNPAAKFYKPTVKGESNGNQDA
jgi:hypothetical protein